MIKIDLGQEISYNPDEKGYVMFDLTNFIPQQSSQVVDGVELLPKNEYHSSLVSLERYIQDKDEAHRIALSIKEYLMDHQLTYAGLGDERYVCKREERMTLVAPVAIEGLDEFRAFITSLIPDFDPPFSHITLLKSAATEFGIGINSMSDLDQYCTRFDQ